MSGCSVKLIIRISVISSVFRCTMNKIPETKELLNKSRLPLGVLIHPFRDINVSKREKSGTETSMEVKVTNLERMRNGTKHF